MPTGRSRKCPWIVTVVAWSSTIAADCQGLSRDRDVCRLGGYGIAFRNFMMPSMDSAFFICIIARNSVISCWASLLFRVELYAERSVIEAVFSVIGIQNVFQSAISKTAARCRVIFFNRNHCSNMSMISSALSMLPKRAGLTSCRMFTLPLKPEQKNFPCGTPFDF
ncbi:hypothetical protein EV421DRAFT_706690 [Armillaria borealis]|uniref:Secreted protein n=1 Tax=Armillaria borealis TaxID=47425 RepID=A0AA39K372_9AGAR|nr:hypothetical protein EV421DRAFT_706690 [Armillaria borealis]